MNFVTKKTITVILVIIWAVAWCNFLMRDLFKKGRLRDYGILIKRNAEEKRSYTYGDDFYGFLKHAKSAIPPGASFGFTGPKEYSLERRRAVYYLYPLLESPGPDYILDCKNFVLRKIK